MCFTLHYYLCYQSELKVFSHIISRLRKEGGSWSSPTLVTLASKHCNLLFVQSFLHCVKFFLDFNDKNKEIMALRSHIIKITNSIKLLFSHLNIVTFAKV